MNNIPEDLVKQIKDKTKWFDAEFASVYGELCTCEGAGSRRLPVIEIYSLMEILEEYFKNSKEE